MPKCLLLIRIGMRWLCWDHCGQIPRSCCTCGMFSEHSRVILVACKWPKRRTTKLGRYVTYARTEYHYKVLCTYQLEEKVPRDFHKYFLDNWHACRHMWVHCWRGSSLHTGNQTTNRLENSHGNVKAYTFTQTVSGYFGVHNSFSPWRVRWFECGDEWIWFATTTFTRKIV